MLRTLFIGAVIAVAATVGIAAQIQRGVVTDDAGRPLAGASVVSWGTDVLVTGQDGSFVVTPTTFRVRVLLDGYEPRIVPAADLGKPIVLRSTAKRPRYVPLCRSGQTGAGSGFLRIATPKGVEVASAITDKDEGNVTERWSRANASLEHSSGPHVTSGWPAEQTLAAMTDIDERDVRLPAGEVDDDRGTLIIDVRGRLLNGRRYRFVGWRFEVFEYSGASDAEAAFFDRMLDGMCYADLTQRPAPARR